jgi:pyroglutamyl-peptidase
MKILLTAFDPFGGESVNASMELLRLLPDRIGSAEIVKQILPTVFRQSAELVCDAMDALRPDGVICLGQAAGRKQVTPELIAVNLQYARIPDNAGNSPMDLPVVPEGPAAYFATLPVRAMTGAMEKAGVPAAVSYSAGAYVCNDLFYRLLHRFRDTGTRVDFIHVPAVSELDPTLAARAVEQAIRIL